MIYFITSLFILSFLVGLAGIIVISLPDTGKGKINIMDTREEAKIKVFDFGKENIKPGKYIDIAEHNEKFVIYQDDDKIGEFPFTDMEPGDLYEVSHGGNDGWMVKRFSRIDENGDPVFVNKDTYIGHKHQGWRFQYYHLICKKENFETNK